MSLGVGRLTIIRGRPNLALRNITLTIGNRHSQSHWRGEFDSPRELGQALMNLELGRTRNFFTGTNLMYWLRENIREYLVSVESSTNSGTSEVLDNFWDAPATDIWGEISFDLPIGRDNEQQYYNEMYSEYFDPTDMLNEREWAASAVPVVERALRGRGITNIQIEELTNSLEIRSSGINNDLGRELETQLNYYSDQINNILGTDI